MRELRVVGLDVDGRRIICETDDSKELFSLRNDDRLRAAVRGDKVASNQTQIDLEVQSVLRPKEIQAKIRAGASVEQVAAAVGIQATRGDQLTVENLAFAPAINPKDQAEMASRERWDKIWQLAVPALWLVGGLVVFFMLVLPMLRKLSSAINRPAPLRVAGEAAEGEAPVRKQIPIKSAAELQSEIEAELNAESISSAPEAQRRQVIKKRLQESATGDPETVASLVRSWMLEDGK